MDYVLSFVYLLQQRINRLGERLYERLDQRLLVLLRSFVRSGSKSTLTDSSVTPSPTTVISPTSKSKSALNSSQHTHHHYHYQPLTIARIDGHHSLTQPPPANARNDSSHTTLPLTTTLNQRQSRTQACQPNDFTSLWSSGGPRTGGGEQEEDAFT